MPFTKGLGKDEKNKTGLMKSHVPGRTDKLPLDVKAESYVVPADIVSSLGQGNSLAGGKMLDKLLGLYKDHKETGGRVTPIIVAGGEYIIPSSKVRSIGNGDYQKGHDILDEMVKNVRAHTIKILKNLPHPNR